jgi:hypothetical protein
MTTIVTALYNINRENLDGRSWDLYLHWFRNTLQLKSPMVIFVDPSMRDFVELRRSGYSTLIIEESIENAPYYHLKDSMDYVINSKDYQERIKDPSRIECKSSLYNIIQYSKFGWVKKASEINPFNTDLYLWLDAGISRFFNPVGLDINKEYPSTESINRMGDIKDKTLIQIFLSNYPELVNSQFLSTEYLLDNRSYIAGGIFMSHKDSIALLKDEIDNILKNEMLEKSILNNEQIALGYLFKKNPQMFHTFNNISGLHRDYEILRHLQY